MGIVAVKQHKKVVSKSGLLAFDFDGKCLTIQLPSGRKLFYREPSFTLNKWNRQSLQYKGMNQVTRKWEYVDTYGGKIVENIVQATARDLLADSMLRLDRNNFKIVMHVHDEAACETPIVGAEKTLEKMCEIMGEDIPWAKGLPLVADGYITPFYKKD